MKYQLLALTFFTFSLKTEAQSFSDRVDVVSDMPPGSLFLDPSPYPNTVIGKGSWEVIANPFSSISSLDINHYIFLFGEGSLESVTVYGITLAGVSLVVNSGMPNEQMVLGEPGVMPDEYFFDLDGYNLYQGGSTLIVGFDSIDVINFTGTYTVVPEPAAASALVGAVALTLSLGRRRIKIKK